MSYNNDYSDDFPSEHYDDFSEQYSIRDAVLNDLIRISKGNNIKALRQYITLHKSDLKGYKTRLLNNVVPLDGYKFVRRDDKLMIIKLGKTQATPSQVATPVSPVVEEPKETIAQESIEPVNSQKNDEESAVQESQTKAEPQEIHSEEQNKSSSLGDSSAPVNSNLLAASVASPSQEVAKPVYELPESVNKMINSLLKQSNDQNEAQKKQYEQLANTLNESIAAKNNAEQERTNRLNTVVDIIEKTFSEGTFDKIVESNTKMVEALTAKHNMDISLLQASQSQTNNDVHDINEEIGSLRSRFASLEDNDSMQDLEERIQELEIANQDLENENKSLNDKLTQMQTIIKQHASVINNCVSLMMNAVDEELFKQFFPNLVSSSATLPHASQQ